MASRHDEEWAAAKTADAVCCGRDTGRRVLGKRKILYVTCLICLPVAVRVFSVPAAVVERVNAKRTTLTAVELCHCIIYPWGFFSDRLDMTKESKFSESHNLLKFPGTLRLIV